MNKKIIVLCMITLATLTACNDKKESENKSPSIKTSKNLNHGARKKCMKTYQQNRIEHECLPATKPTNCIQSTYESLKAQGLPSCSQPKKSVSPNYLLLANWKQCLKVSKGSNNTTTWCLPTERKKKTALSTHSNN